MKRLIAFLFILISHYSHAQFEFYSIDFENSQYLSSIKIDSTLPNNRWQIGDPQKLIFESGINGSANAILTDTVNDVPAGDSSVFYLIHPRSPFAPFHFFTLQFFYMLDIDSTFTARVEVSGDRGTNWINILEEDTTYDFSWNAAKPNLDTSAHNWTEFNVEMMSWASGWGTYPHEVTSDSIYFRFTFISTTNGSKEGWMIDNFHLEDWYEGIIENSNQIKIGPNPSNGELRISGLDQFGEYISVQDISGKVILRQRIQSAEQSFTLPKGIYLFRIPSADGVDVRKVIVL